MVEQDLICLQAVSKSYALEGVSSHVLKSISLSVKKGEMLAIVGASGSGKSTLMNIIGLLDRADSGHYFLQQRDVSELSNDDAASLRNQSIGFVFQQFNLLSRFTAHQNVALPLVYRHSSTDEIQRRVSKALDRVGMLKYIKHRPSQLSGGQQQRVAIARALVAEPEVILADEPTGALDSKTSSEVMQLFLDMHKEGRTLIIVTHDEQVAAQCQRRIILADGAIVHEDKR